MTNEDWSPASATVVATALRTMGPKPRALASSLQLAAQFEDEPAVSVEELLRHLADSAADDATRLLVHRALLQWDALDDQDWAGATRHQTQERREQIYGELKVGSHTGELLSRLFPHYRSEDPGFEIFGQFNRWFDQAEQEQAGFYWPAYRNLLEEVEGWPQPNVENLSRASKLVVERLCDPGADDASAFAARGMVVGYVQSGKTANFTGVIARAVDAGYRLVVVLTGMTNILRQQTQRRLDKQLIGRELLQGVAAGEFEYEDARDWDAFISYGSRPREQGRPDWRRLTSFSSDYRRLGQGIAALHFELPDKSQPINAPDNLRTMPVRLVVAMKNRKPLDDLIKDLRQVARAGFDISRLPALLIDDESDQASVNTTRPPNPGEVRTRTAINRRITELLDLLPRAQYVGYTATPFANVFVDPNDKIGIYPRDFIIGLDRPAGYMGASDFHDFRPPPDGLPGNERSYVRSVKGDDMQDDNLRHAIDCYLLSGAIKLMRKEAETPINTKHHTMLVHTSHRTIYHEILRDQLVRLVEGAGYADGRAFDRLTDILMSDFREISSARAAGLPFPNTFDELRTHLETCYTRLLFGATPVLIVNGDKRFEEETPDFDKQEVWKVLVGGTKLSRGYTIEGLTVSYYRRTARAADTLMQMGRWFGFRQSYRDLVRLFIGREEPLTKKKTIDLYAAFGGICQDELDFREQLDRYALPEDGGDPLRPIDVPLLVTQRVGDLKPSAANRMFNARQLSANFGGKPINPTLAPTERKKVARNQQAVRELFRSVPLDSAIVGDDQARFRALVGVLTPIAVITFLEAYTFSKENLLDRQLSFLRGELGDPEIDRWVAGWPLLSGQADVWRLVNGHEPNIIERSRGDTGRFNIYTGSDHVDAARILCGTRSAENATAETRALTAPRTGAALFYAVKELGNLSSDITIGFALYPPRNQLREITKWGVVLEDQPDDPIVSLPA